MQIKATVTLQYDSEIMDAEHLTEQEFFQLVSRCTLDDFNGGVEFDPAEIDMEVVK